MQIVEITEGNAPTWKIQQKQMMAKYLKNNGAQNSLQ